MIPVWLRYGERLGGLLRRVRFSASPALLVIKPGSLGDAFLSTGAMHALRRQFPRHQIVMATSARALPVLERCAAIDVLLALDELEGGKSGVAARWQRLFFAVSLFCRKYELVVFPCFDDGSGWGGMLFERVQAERKFCLSDPALRGVHEMDKTLAVLQAAGCAVASRQDIWPDAGIRGEERQLATKALRPLHLRERSHSQSGRDSLAEAQRTQRNEERRTKNQELVLALCAGARFRQKQWGAEKFAQLLVQLGKREEEREREGQKTEDRGRRTEDSQAQSTKNQEPDFQGLQTTDFVITGKVSHKEHREAQRSLESAVCSLQSTVLLRVLILGGKEDRTIAGEIQERLQTADRRPQTEDECAGDVSLAEAQRLQRITNEEPHQPSTFNLQPSTLVIEDWTGRCSLHESFALIEQSDLCVGNDTLGLHVAVAVGTPSVVMMWGGDGEQWIPWGDVEKHRMVRADVDCGGCGGECVRERHECMERISVEMVMGEIERMSLAEARRAQRLA